MSYTSIVCFDLVLTIPDAAADLNFYSLPFYCF